MRKLLFVCAMAMVASACSSDELFPVGPDPQSCTKGSIEVGEIKTGEIDSNSCSMYDWYWWQDSVNFESYNVTVEKGKAYLFTLRGDDSADRSLGLVGRYPLVSDSASLYLAVEHSIIVGDHWVAQIFFVAPTTGTYSLRVFNSEIGESFDYTLTGRECSPRALDITGAYSNDTASLGDDDCILVKAPFTLIDRAHIPSFAETYVALYTVYMDGHSPRAITVYSDDFWPAFMLEGPGFDAWCDTYYCDGTSVSNPGFADSVSQTINVWIPGTYTLTVGTTRPLGTGNFRISISEPLASDALTLREAPHWGELQPGQWKKMTGPR